MTKMLVRAAGLSLVPNYESQDAGILAFVGRRHDTTVGVNGGFVPLDEPVEVPFRAEYVQEVQAGCLTACDAETAKLCGVPFKS